MVTSLKTPPDPPPYPDAHTPDTIAEATQSQDQPQSNPNGASVFDGVAEIARTAVKSLDVDRLVQYGQTTVEESIKPNVLRLIHACDDDPRFGVIIATPVLLSSFMAATFLALAFGIAIVSILTVAVIAGTIMMLGMLQSILVKLVVSGINNLEIASLVEKAREASRNAVDRVRGFRVRLYIPRSPALMAFMGFVVGAHVWIIPALIAKSAQKPPVHRGPITIQSWRPWRSRPHRPQSKWRKILTGIAKAAVSIAVVFSRIGRAFFRNFAERIVSKLACVVRMVLLGLVRIVHQGVRTSLRKATGIWPMMCFALFLYCLLLHHRTNKLAHKVEGGRKRRQASQ